MSRINSAAISPKSLPWKTYDEALQASFTTLYKEQGTKTGAKDADDFWQKVQDQGGWWSAEEKPLPDRRRQISVRAP